MRKEQCEGAILFSLWLCRSCQVEIFACCLLKEERGMGSALRMAPDRSQGCMIADQQRALS